jgi:hypothetical protein
MCTILNGRCVISRPSADWKVGGGREVRQVEPVLCRSCFSREERVLWMAKFIYEIQSDYLRRTGCRGRDSPVCISTELRAGRSWFESQHGQEILSFSIESRPALGPTHSHLQWVPAFLSLGAKLQELEADDSLRLMPRLGMVELYLHSPHMPSWRNV